MEIFQYEFMQRAFIIGILTAIIIPSIGVIIALKRLSMMGDALAHNALAGVVIGFIIGINPVLSAVIFSILAALAIEQIRKYYKKYAEIAIAVVMSAGIGIVWVLSGYVKDGALFSRFLFGSITATTNFELLVIVVLSLTIICTLILLYKEMFYITFDEEAARLSGIPVKRINFLFTIITAVTISVAAGTTGTLMISSLLVIPVAAAVRIAKSYRQTIILAVTFGVISTIAGLIISFYADLKPGGTIVLLTILILISVLVYKEKR